MTAFTGADAPKTGAGRGTRKLPAVPDVETLPCPAGDTHTLTNTPTGTTACTGCGQPWAVLDQQARTPRRTHAVRH